MNLKIGQIVEYSDSHYVIMDVQFKNIEGRDQIYVHIKDVNSNDILYVNSKNVKVINEIPEEDLQKTNDSEDFDFEDLVNEDIKKIEESNVDLENKTDYLNSLFSQINQENTFEFFDIEKTATSEKNVSKEQNEFSTLKNPTKVLTQNLSQEKKEEIKPRRKGIDDQELRTQPYFDRTDSLSTKIRNNNNSLENLSNNEVIKPRREINEESLLIDNSDITPSSDFEENLEFLNNDKTIVEPSYEPGFSESTDDDFNVTSETNKFILGEIQVKAKQYSENRNRKQILITKPVNPKQLKDIFDNKSDKSIFDEVTRDHNQDEDVKELDFGITASDLDKTKTIRKFKLMSNWFIFLVTLSLSVPIAAIIIRMVGNISLHMTDKSNSIAAFNFSLKINSSSIGVVTVFLYTILILFLTPLVVVSTIIYSSIFLVSVLKKQYYTLAYVAKDSIEKKETIQLLKEFSDESSVFMLKLHRDNKDNKKQIKKLAKASGTSIYSKKDINDVESKVIN